MKTDKLEPPTSPSLLTPSSPIESTSDARSPSSPSARIIRRKLVVIGDGACGKTSLLVSYKDHQFRRDYIPTVFETTTTTVPIEDKVVELSLWDTAGKAKHNIFLLRD